MKISGSNFVLEKKRKSVDRNIIYGIVV